MADRNAELEAQIAKSSPSSDDAALYQVYADWLGDKGDPRGELISLSLALEKTPKDPGILAQLAELHTSHDAAWIGALARPTEGITLGWRRGFIDTITIGDEESSKIVPGDAYRVAREATRDSAVAVFIRKLTLASFEDDDNYQPNWEPITKAMVEVGIPGSLTELSYRRGGFWDISATDLGALEALYPQLGMLRKLYIELGRMDLGTMMLPELRDFEVYTGGFTKENMRSVLEATWPKLERLVLRFGGSEDYGATCTIDDVLPLLKSASLKNVTQLGLANAPFADALVLALGASKLLPQLTWLDLSMGELSDEGATFILENAPSFAHLELDVSDNFVTEDLVARLQEVLPKVEASEQKDTSDEWRYCTIGE